MQLKRILVPTGENPLLREQNALLPIAGSWHAIRFAGAQMTCHLSLQRLISRGRLSLLTVMSAAVLSSAFGQTTQTVTITSTVPQVLSLGIDTNAVSIPFLASDYNTSTGAATKTIPGGNTLSVTSNKNWTVSLKANTAAFSFVPSAGDPDPAKPCGNLSYKVSTSGTYVAITTSNVAVKTGNKGGSGTAGNTFVMDYQLTSNLSQDPPGTYTLATVYTLTAP